MDVFDLDQTLISSYERFARSFTKIRSQAIRRKVDAIYSERRYWPEPLISINPFFEKGSSVEELAALGAIHENAAAIFKGVRLHRHQDEALAKAHAGQSFVVTTGTGSGKSMCFFVPIIDAAARARARGEAPRTRAIIVYPMNALANSQMNELSKFISSSNLPVDQRPTFARYTGQESDDERELIRSAKPDILLTNFMMLELLLTRQNARDRAVVANADGLDFIVLDELHTYRGRQGADVAMLVRRLKDRVCKDKRPICIGTSATMASEGDSRDRNAAVAAVASRLFGEKISPEAVIGESLRRATDQRLTIADQIAPLKEILQAPIPKILLDSDLYSHPLAIWIELEIGLKDELSLERRKPTTLSSAAKRLSELTGVDSSDCSNRLKEMLTLMSLPEAERGGSSDKAFMAFKLHQFISGAGFAYTTAQDDQQRTVTVDGQLFDPANPDAFLYPTFFCRNCGQDHLSVRVTHEDGVRRVEPRSIDDAPLDGDEADDLAGYLMLEPKDDDEFSFDGSPESYPEEWVETGPGGVKRLRSARRAFAPERIFVSPNGVIGAGGRPAWFSKGKFKICPACGDQPPGQAREINKLAGLSGEGRSSTSTLLVSTALRWMNDDKHHIDKDKRKLLGFTDNRQDAALQAGHFNDFMFVTLLRAAMLVAVRQAGSNGLGDEDFGRSVQKALGFVAAERDKRIEWMFDPGSKGPAQIDAEKALARVLSHRVWADQRRGWRFTNPSLIDLGLVKPHYVGVDELVADASAFAEAPARLRNLHASERRNLIISLLEAMRSGLAVATDALDGVNVESLSSQSRQYLREPWSIGMQETPRTSAAFIVDTLKKEDIPLRGEPLIVRGGPRSGLAKQMRKASIWGERLSEEDYDAIVRAMLSACEQYGLIRKVETNFEIEGWRLAASAVRLTSSAPDGDARKSNRYFIDLYSALADGLIANDAALFGLEAREHTAQVDQERREWRERRFRWGEIDRADLNKDQAKMKDAGEANVFLPALFCSPTMELGVDISALNAVYLRNAPPTPANYAQRAGRAGRSGQAALIVTYCAAQSPHDQYYFSRQDALVHGVVRPPALDLSNEDLVEAHLHAVWLAESGCELPADIPHVIDIQKERQPVADALNEVLANAKLRERSAHSMLRIVKAIESELSNDAGEWASDLPAFVSRVSASASSKFSDAFDRWRTLYQGAHEQLRAANRIAETPGISAKERREAKSRAAHANDQISLLEKGQAKNGSDFYTYRYLATEGFLPGYNFPRLPLYAFIPATSGSKTGSTFLQRARFLAIAEFGPKSLIYHEGRAYRVTKARLSSEQRTLDEGRLATQAVWLCDHCGAYHEAEVERCEACDESMVGVHPVRNTLRIDNVETTPTERITANDEDRQRQGFEIQTAFAWPKRSGRSVRQGATAVDADGEILSIDYAGQTTISRLNKGLRRRRDKSILGFGIDPISGKWVRAPGEEAVDANDAEQEPPQRVVPIVQDRKNAALVTLAGGGASTEVMATLQHALTRGVEIVFELEEGEILTEPTPSKDDRKKILAYEATEGGAGALARLIQNPEALSKVARAALETMHYEGIEEAATAADPQILRDAENVECVKGCYRCLLSYYNQTDHALIDRTDPTVLLTLLRLVRGGTRLKAKAQAQNHPWKKRISEWGLPSPDESPLTSGAKTYELVWREHMAVAKTSTVSDEERSNLDSLGFAVVELPPSPTNEPPQQLIDLIGGRS